jgi:hypothetical protein
VGQSNIQSLSVINSNTVGFKLTTEKKNGDIKDFKVTGGTCKSSGVAANSQCAYLLTYKPSQKHVNMGEDTTLLITAKPDNGDNPQTIPVTLAGFALPKPTPTGSPSSTPTMTPTPAPTPALTTDPVGTLAFPATLVGQTVTESLSVINSDPVTAFTLTAQNLNGNVNAFKITGGTCKSSGVAANSSCTYSLTFTPTKAHEGSPESTAFVITAKPNNKENAQTLVVTLASFAL